MARLQETTTEKDQLKNSIRTTVPFKIGQRNSVNQVNGAGACKISCAFTIARLPNHGGGSNLFAGTPAWRGSFSNPAAQRTEKQKDELYVKAGSRRLIRSFKQDTAALAALEKEQAEIKSRGTEALVMDERPEPAVAYVLFRGDYDKRRDKVEPNTPAALPPMPANFPRNRLGFARWLVLPENPLTARVTVNRFWLEVFGSGLVKTAGDFGVTGDLPRHPEQLDWLAVDFRESGWDMKRFFKMLVTSAAYRQSAAVWPEKLLQGFGQPPSCPRPALPHGCGNGP